MQYLLFFIKKWLQEHAFVFHYTQVASLVCFSFELVADGRVCSLYEHKQNIAAVYALAVCIAVCTVPYNPFSS
jgi:hypothetical protein